MKLIKFLKIVFSDNILIQKTIGLLKSFSLPGFKSVSLFEVGKFVYFETLRDSIHIRAESIAFNVFLSFFPTIIFFFELTSLLPIQTLDSTLFDFLRDILPRSAYFFITDSIKQITELNPKGNSVSLIFLLSIFFASNGVNSLMTAFRKRPNLIERQRNFLRQRGIAILLTILLAIVVIITLTIIITGQIYLNKSLLFFGIEKGLSYFIIQFLKWVMIFFLILNFISILYYFTPAVKDKWSYFSPGSIFATFLCIATSVLFSFYINNFGKYSLLYGYVGTIMVLMVWIYLNALIIIIGFEMNLGIDIGKRGKIEVIT